MSEYHPRHRDTNTPNRAPEPGKEHLERAIRARLQLASLPPVPPDQLGDLIDDYKGTYLTVREAIIDLTEAHDWQPMLDNLAETTGYYGVFTVDWEGVEQIVRDNYHLIEDGDLIHVFETSPGETPLPPGPAR